MPASSMTWPKALLRWQPWMIVLALLAWPYGAKAEHICGGRSDEYVISEVYVAGGGVVESWCEWSSKGGAGAEAMRFYSPKEWQAFADHGAQVDAANEQARKLAVQRYNQLKSGLWFLPGEVPFAGWSAPLTASARRRTVQAAPISTDCTASFWTPNGAVILSASGGHAGQATIRYLSYNIPSPPKPETRKVSLTQNGETQNVLAVISRVGLGKRTMGMVSFAVPSGDTLVDAIDEVQDYTLADRGKQIFSGKWNDGVRIRDALRRCLVQRG